MKTLNLKCFVIFLFTLFNFKSNCQDAPVTIHDDESVVSEVVIEADDPYLPPAELEAYKELTQEIITYFYDFTNNAVENKYQKILKQIKSTTAYLSYYDKLLFIIDYNNSESNKSIAREGYGFTREGAPNQIKYLIQFNADGTIDFEYRHTLK